MMIERIAKVAAWLVAVGIIFIGARFLLAPEVAATGYGIPVAAGGDVGAYLAVKGIRDIVSGFIVIALLLAGQRRALAIAMLVFAIIPAGDAVIVIRQGGSLAAAFGIHGVTAIVLLAIGVALIRAPARDGLEARR